MTTTARRVRSTTAWTGRLEVLVAVCSIVFTIGTTLQNFVIINPDMIEHSMRLAGDSAAEATDGAPAFLWGLRIVGCVYIVGNALGVLAFRGRTWVFWVAVAVNVTQAAGVFVIPSEVFQASMDAYGVAGVLPSLVTDGGALLLSLCLLASLVRFRTTWAHRRT